MQNKKKYNWIDPEIILPIPNKEYNCRAITLNNFVYNIRSEILDKGEPYNCYYIIWCGYFLILISYAESND